MLLFLRDRLPASLICEIALFDGRIFRAYLRGYISEVYSNVYKTYFGARHSLKFITGGFHGCDLLASLPFYAAWSTRLRGRYPYVLKLRKSRKHMLPYKGVIPHARLVKERQKLEGNLEQYFHELPKISTYFSGTP
jgi:hypothetical protein